MSYPVEGAPDDRHAIPYPSKSSRGWFALAFLTAACSVVLIVLAQWFGTAPGLYGALIGMFSFGTFVAAASRWFKHRRPNIWLDDDMLEYRMLHGGTVLFNLLTLGGAYVSVQHAAQYPVIFLDFRTDAEEQDFVHSGFNPPPRPIGYLNRVPMAGVVGADSMLAQYFSDEINRRRGLYYHRQPQLT